MRHLSNGPEEIMCDIEMQSVSFDNLGHNEPGNWLDGDSTGEFLSQDDLINQVIAEGDDCMIDEENLFEDSISDTDMFEEISVDLQHFADSLTDLATNNSQTGSFVKEMLEFGGSSISNLSIFNEFEDDVLEDDNYFEQHDEMLVEETTANIQIFINGTNEKWEILKNSLRETSTRSVFSAKDNLIKPKSYIQNEKPIGSEESMSQVLKYDINNTMMSEFEKDVRDSEESVMVSNTQYHSLSNAEKNFTVYSEESLLAVLESDTDKITDSVCPKNIYIESGEQLSGQDSNNNKDSKLDIENHIDVYSEESLLAVLESDNDGLIDSPSPKKTYFDSDESFLITHESHIDKPDIEKHIAAYSDESLLAVLETDTDDLTNSTNPKNIHIDSGESFLTSQESHTNQPSEPDIDDRVAAFSDESLLVVLGSDSDDLTDSINPKNIYVDSQESFLTVKESHVNLHTERSIDDNIATYPNESFLELESNTGNVTDSSTLRNNYVDSKVSLFMVQESHINKRIELYNKERIDTYSEESLLEVLESDIDVVDSLNPRNIYVVSKESLKMQELHTDSTKAITENDMAVHSEETSLMVVNPNSCITKTNLVDSEELFLLESSIDNFTNPSVEQQNKVYSRELFLTDCSVDPFTQQLTGVENIASKEPSMAVLASNFSQLESPNSKNQITIYMKESDSDNLTMSQGLSVVSAPKSNIDNQNVESSIFVSIPPKFENLSGINNEKDSDDDSEESFLMALQSDIDHPSETLAKKQDMFYSDESLLAVLDSDVDTITNKIPANSKESLLTDLDSNIVESSKPELVKQMNFYSEESLLAVLESDIINFKKPDVEKDISFHSEDSLLAALNSNVNAKPENGNSIIFEIKESLPTVLQSNLDLAKVAKRKHVTSKPIASSRLPDMALNDKDDLPFSCDVCSLKFKHASYLKRHKTIHNEVKDFECDKCNYKCKNVWALDTHKKLHTDEKPFSCKLCDYKCKTAGYLKAHKVKHSKATPFSCPMCDLKFKTSRMLKFHKMTHDDESKLTCDVCNKKFTSPTNLRSHKIIHNDEEPLKCDQCSFSCKNLSYLTRHKKTHTQKPLACGICSYTCNSISSLKRHKITHSDEQPFSCELCGAKCKNAGILKQHMIIHSEDKPFACDMCEYRCKRASYLKTHKAIHANKNGSSNTSQYLNLQPIQTQ